MGFKVNFDALDGLLGSINQQTNSWLTGMESLNSAVDGLCASQNIKGDAADNIKQYMSNVHGTIIGLLGQLISLHSSNFLLYKQDYHQNIDTDLHANISEAELLSLKNKLSAKRSEALAIDGEVQYALAQIRDIFYYTCRDASEVTAAHKSTEDFLTDLADEINALEGKHLSSDFANSAQLISSLRSFIAETAGTGRSYKSSFSPDKLSGSSSFQQLYEAYVGVNKELEDKADAIETAIENENQRASALQKEYEEYLERQRKAKIINWVVTGVAVVGSIAAIAFTGGAATPLVVAGISAASSALIAGTKNVTSQYVENGSLNNFNFASFGKDVLVGAATGFVTGYVGAGVGGAVTSTLSKTALGSTLLNSSSRLVRMGASAVIGGASEVVSGVATRGAVTLMMTGDIKQALTSAFDAKNILIDAATGGAFGALGGIKDPNKGKNGPVIDDDQATPSGDVSIGNPAEKPKQVHHYATNKSKKYTDSFEKIADKYGLSLDGDWNKELLPHQGRHPNDYHEFILDEMTQIDQIAQGNKEVFLDLFEENVKSVIRENPDMLYKKFWMNIGG